MHAPTRLPLPSHSRNRSPRLLSAVVLAVASIVALAACGGDSSKGATTASAKAAGGAGSACNRGDTTAAYVAFKEFIKVTVPTPQRFLTAAGTDSAAPDAGFRAMQDKGPSFFYSSDPAAQKKLLTKLANDGPYASLLIVHRGTTTSGNGDTVAFKLGGHFVGGEHDGQAAASHVVTVVCRDSTWKLGTMADEPKP